MSSAGLAAWHTSSWRRLPRGKIRSMRSPLPSSPAAETRMRANRGKDTGPELKLRRELHSRGLRYRIHRKIIPGLRRSADIVFPKARLAVFVDGCFWHGCPVHGTTAKSNRSYWDAKIEENRQRDRDTDRRLREAGWKPLRIWEHQPVLEAADLIQAALTASAVPSPHSRLTYGCCSGGKLEQRTSCCDPVDRGSCPTPSDHCPKLERQR
jgi:DNA mismatch endonuclease, patch repair protein